MITLGIDLASQPELTGICEITWGPGRASITDIRVDVNDTELKRKLGSDRLDKIGVDIPLGWPDPFVAAMNHHRAMEHWPDSQTNQLRYRATDEFVNRELKTRVLSVSSDRIAIPAFRAARLLSEVLPSIDRTGAGRVCEVYPAEALRRWGLTFKGYKGKKNFEVRQRLVENLLHKTEEWLRLSDSGRKLCERDDNAFDAVVASLVSRASVCGLIDAVPRDLQERASREGWIALPLPESLDKLCEEYSGG
jgi:hypothetical protein